MTSRPSPRRRVLATAALISLSLGLPVGDLPIANASYTTCRPSPDTVPAAVDTVTFSAPTVDVSQGPASITMSAHVVDYGNVAPSGTRLVRIQVIGPRDEFHGHLSLTSGTPADGIWSRTFTLPSSTVSGTFRVRLLEVRDTNQNDVYYIRGGKYPNGPLDPRLQPGWQTFNVTGGESATIRPPGKLTSFRFSRRSVDTTNGPRSIRAVASFATPQPRRVLLYLIGRSHAGPPYFISTHLRQQQNGGWSRRIKVPTWTGDMTVRATLGVTYAGNVKPNRHNIRLRSHALQRKQAFTIHGKLDTTKPTLSALSIPASVDTTAGPSKIAVSATTSDGESGVGRVVIRFFAPGHHSVGFAYAKGQQVGDAWTGTVRIPNCVTSGAWKVGVYLQDLRGNHVDYTPKRLAAAGLPSHLEVTSTPPGDLYGLGIAGSSASSTDHTITLDFDKGVKTVNDSTLTVYDATKTATEFTAPLSIASIICSNGVAVVNCDGSGGLTTSAVLSVPSLTAGTHYAVYANQHSVTPQLSDASGNPLGWDGYVAAVKAG